MIDYDRRSLKVLHLVAGNLYGGVEAFLVTLARYREAAPSMQATFAVCFEGRLARELEALDAEVVRLGSARVSRPWTVLRARERLAKLITAKRPDVAVCHGAWPHVVLAPPLRKAGVPLVFFQHDAANGRHFLELASRLLSPEAVIANSRFTAGTTSRIFPHATPLVFHYPVPSVPPLPAGEREALRKELGVSAHEVMIVQTSRIEPWKGQHRHLAVLGRLRDQPDWVSVIAGGPQRPKERSYYEQLQRLAGELHIAHRVRFVGQRSDIFRLLGAADLHFQPNQGPEPFGIAFVEAMLAGLPVVTLRMGALSEYVTPDAGILAEDEEGLARALASLLDAPDKRREMGKNARFRAGELCQPERQVPKFAEILTVVADSSSNTFPERG